MKQLWVRVDPYDKRLVTTALESRGRRHLGAPGRVPRSKPWG